VPVEDSLYQELYQRILTVTAQTKVRKTSVKRLALLVTGIVAAQGVVLAKVADELLSLRLTKATQAESLERTLGRILSDEKLEPQVCYEPAVKATVDWDQLVAVNKSLVLAVDESTKEDQVHLFRVGLPYWGHCLPLAWDIWPQNQPLPKQYGYWPRVDAVLGRIPGLLPPGLEVIGLADRAYDIPGFTDRLKGLGWHWAVRCKAKGSGCFRDHRGREWPLRALIGRQVRAPGMRWKARGWVFKDAGWREASVVAFWGLHEDEPLVVISDLPPRWELLRLYGLRFWIEPGFRSDKKLGWHWEDSQIKKLEHHRRLLLGMAWASLVTLCIGLREAKARLTKLWERRIRSKNGQRIVGKPRNADQSLFTMGLRRTRDWLYQATDRAIEWLLNEWGTVTWQHIWYQHQSRRYLMKTVRP